MTNEKEAEKILKNWEKFRDLCNKLGSRSANVNKMLDHFQDRLMYCPASSRAEYHNCFTGGLVEHSLNVLSCLLKLCKTFDKKTGVQC